MLDRGVALLDLTNQYSARFRACEGSSIVVEQLVNVHRANSLKKTKTLSKMASPEQKKTRTGDNLPSTAAANRFSGRVAIVTGGASGSYLP